MHAFCTNVDICYRHTFILASPCLHWHSICKGSLTKKWNTTPRSVFAPTILCHAFIRPCILLLEIRDFKDGIWVLHFDFAGKRDTAGSPPAYFWDRAAKDEQKVPMVATVSSNDQSLIKHRRNETEARALWVSVACKSNSYCSDFWNS